MIRYRLVHVWRDLALQESRALRELVRAHGRIPNLAPLDLPVLEQTAVRLILTGHRIADDPVGDVTNTGKTCTDVEGTAAGYRRHRRAKETACSACLQAHAAHRRTQKRGTYATVTT